MATGTPSAVAASRTMAMLPAWNCAHGREQQQTRVSQKHRQKKQAKILKDKIKERSASESDQRERSVAILIKEARDNNKGRKNPPTS
jgi:hypothetical protein